TLIGETSLRFGTGVVNLSHRHPIVVAAEAAQFDQLSGGRLMLGVGPGGLTSDGELFGRPTMEERTRVAMESIEMIIDLWSAEAPIDLDGEFWSARLQSEYWPSHGVGQLARPVQRPHPPLAMALSSPDGNSVRTVAERGFIPISANFVPSSVVAGQWQTYCEVRAERGLPIDPGIWRVCRNILITESDAEAEELTADPDGTFAHYFRYLGGVRDMPRIRAEEDGLTLSEINDQYRVPKAIEKCVIAGSAETVTERLVALVDEVGPFGTLVAVGHDWDDDGRRWLDSLTALATEVAPVLGQHVAAAGAGTAAG
ncbi:MAG: LLM class flavin-dependent oxidoreductase, partial [Actinomycetota bacterium]